MFRDSVTTLSADPGKARSCFLLIIQRTFKDFYYSSEVSLRLPWCKMFIVHTQLYSSELLGKSNKR